jgi:hypothetical protein
MRIEVSEYAGAGLFTTVSVPVGELRFAVQVSFGSGRGNFTLVAQPFMAPAAQGNARTGKIAGIEIRVDAEWTKCSLK